MSKSILIISKGTDGLRHDCRRWQYVMTNHLSQMGLVPDRATDYCGINALFDIGIEFFVNL